MKKTFPIMLLLYANILFAQFPCSTGFNANGAEDFITVPNTDAINLQNTRNRTIEFWFKAPDITTRQVIYEEGGNVNAITIYIQAGSIYLGAYRDNASVAADRRYFRSGTGDIEANKWYHVALTIEDTTSPDITQKWFLNGVEQDSQNGLQVNTHSGNVSYGRNGDGIRYPTSLADADWDDSSIMSSNSETYSGAFFESSTTFAFTGNINLFRIWNVARTETEINTNKSVLLTNETDLVAYADLDRIYYVPNGATEISLTAFVSVTTQFTTIPNTDAINLQNTEDRTIEFRFRATDLTTRQVVYEEGGNVNAIKVFIEGGRIYFSVYRSNADTAVNRRYFRSAAGALSIGEWYHVALSLDNATTLKWFLDGIEQDSQAGLVVDNHSGDINIGKSGGDMRYPSSLLDADWSASSLVSSSSQTYNGTTTSSGSANNYSGDIDLFRIWNVARTPTEIDTNKNTFLDTGTLLVAYQSGTQINYQPNGGSSPSASEESSGLITWDGSDSDSYTTAANWVADSPPDITRSQKIIITNNGTNPVIAADTNVGFLNISTGVNLVVQSGATLNVYYELVNNGTITVENGAALIYHNCSNPISGSGTFNVIRNTRNYDGNDFYSYWSSPLIGTTVATVFADADEVYQYNASTTDADWVSVSGGVTMQPGFGYAIQNEGTGGQVRTFSGTINNGGLDVTLYFNTNESTGETGNVWSPGGDNLAGNPYPSAIDWDLVIEDTDNQNIEGTIYLWNQQSANVGDNSVSDYLLYNVLGPSIDNTATSKIGTAQAFFVRASSALGSGGTTTLKLKATHQVAGDNTSTTFYKSNIKNDLTNKQKGRSWFRLKKDNLYSSILIGFVEKATEKYDRIYDGPFDINQTKLGFYSLVEDTKKATIQGLPLLTENEKMVPLGFVVDETGEYTIHLQEEYIDNSYNIYLEDTESAIFVDLKKQPYTFTIDTVGENNSRFRLIYTKENKETLSLDNPILDDNNLLVFTNSSKELVVKHKNSEEIEKIILYNLLGREVKVFFPNQAKTIADLDTGVYLVKTTLKTNKTITKKIVIAN